MGKDVFISYSRKDSDVANYLIAALEDAGISFFLDKKGLSGGEQFINVISKEIKECKVFLFIASRNSLESKWTMKELSYAFQEKPGQSILPLLVDDIPLPDSIKFLFSDINIINFFTQDDTCDIIVGLQRMLGERKRSCSMFTGFFEDWLKETDEVEKVLRDVFGERFGPIESFDLFETSYYQRFLSAVTIPYEIVAPQGSWTDNYDFDLLKKIVFAAYVDKGFWEYSLGIDKRWKLNPQSDPHFILQIEKLGGYLLRWNFNELTDNDIRVLRYTLFKVLIDTMVRWEMPEYKEQIEAEYKNAIDKLNSELSKCEETVFIERTKSYDKIGIFHEERAKVYLGGYIGFINPEGKLITPIEWEDASDFSEGLACVADPQSGRYGYINTSGSLVIPCQWEDARPFISGYAEVANEDGKWIRINNKGNTVHVLNLKKGIGDNDEQKWVKGSLIQLDN